MGRHFQRVLWYAVCIILSINTVGVNGDFERQPKLRLDKDALVLEAAYDKNITIRLSHDSELYFGDFNVLDEIRPLIAAQSKSPETESPTIDSLNGQMRALKRDLTRMNRRLNMLQNRTIGNLPGRYLASRYNRLVGRIRRIETTVENLETNLAINECLNGQSNPCKNGGTCIDIYKGFHCECLAGWAGKTCEEDVNECYMLTGTDLGCQNNGECINTPGSYRCVCSNGYTGNHCRIRNATCETADAAEICVHGACVHSKNANGYTCICDQGWTNNNVTTACVIDVDECALPTNPCHSGCVNLPGSFSCEPCPQGYSGNGIHCLDVNECETNNGGCSMQPSVRCINTEGSYHCGSCPVGWTGDGRHCEALPSSSCAGINACYPRAKCEFISGTMVCTCPLGTFGHGFGENGCTIEGNTTDPCADHACQNNGTCIMSGRGTFCVCKPGYNGPLCDQPDACQAEPCQNGGTCKLLPGNQFICSCRRGTTGKRCEIVRDICGMIIRQETGSITYPPDGSQYEPFERCAWMIRTADSKVLNVTFTKFDLEGPEAGTDECNKDWLQIHDGRALTAQLLGRFCGQMLPMNGTITSSHQQLFFWFRSDASTNGGGFTLSWISQSHTCGGRLMLKEGETGIIRSPGYPGKTPANRECEWELDAPYGFRVILRTYEVILGGNRNCTRDTLKISEGDLELAAYCETAHPEPLHTSSNRVVIHLHTDGYLADSAFQMHYEVAPGAPHCGGIFTEPTGTFSGYTDAPVCEYLIQQPPGLTIQLEITQMNLLMSEDCHLQKIEIYDGKDEDDDLLNRLCGNQTLAEPIVSSTNFLLLRYEFAMHGLPIKKEFQVKYKRLCEDRFIGPEGGIITTPNYPGPYYNDIICTYDIYGPAETVVHVNVTDFSITETIPSPMADESPSTLFDYGNFVEVYLSKDKKRVFYKGEPFSLIADRNHMRIIFRGAKNTQKGRGLRIEYEFEKTGCGGVLLEDYGAIFKNFVFAQDFCEWIIEAPAGKYIFLNMSYTDSTSNGDRSCSAETRSLYIYSNSTDGSSQILGSYCGNHDNIVEPIHSNTVTIILKEPTRIQQNHNKIINFRMKYHFRNSTTDCGGNSTARYGVIRSPNWPNSYGPSMDCVWHITAPLNHQIELIVKNFSLEESAFACNNDFLEIRNGKYVDSPLIGKYCGTAIPGRIPSFTNSLYLHFKSSALMEEKGFYMIWQQTKTGCGGKLNSHVGSFETPNVEEGDDISCDWYITVGAGSTITLKLISYQSSYMMCSGENIFQVFDGPSTHSAVLKYDKDSSRYRLWRSTQNQVLVRYVSQNLNTHCRIEYETNCNNVMPNTLIGVIESPNFPEPYPANLNCSWDIRGSRNNRIALEFSHLMLEQRSPSCDYDYVKVIDMRDDTILSEKHLCNKPDSSIISDGNRLLLKFSSDYSFSERGFRAEYKRLGCGEHQYNTFGILRSPNAPYSVDLECEWYLEAPAGKQLMLTFSEILIEADGANCSENELVIKEDKDSDYNLYRECEVRQNNLLITSPGNRLYIHFHTSSKRSRKFFKATYIRTDAVCGGKFNAPSGSIVSPNYPDMSSNLECIWDITVPDVFGIALEFQGISCGGLSIDVKRYDLISKKSIVQNVCSPINDHSYKFIVPSNHITLNMTARNAAKGRFALTYKKQCGGKISLPTGYLKSEPNDLCEWELTSENGALINLDILRLECGCSRAGNCGVNVADDLQDDTSNLTCSNSRRNFIGEKIFVKTSQVSFQAKFSTLNSICGGTIDSLEGILAAPLYQGTYPAKMECVWKIAATRGNALELSFLLLDIVPTEHCNGDFLEIRTAEIGGRALGVYCGDKIPTESLVVKENVWIKFKSVEGSIGGKGFQLSWSYSHQNEYNSSSGVLESPPVNAARAQEIPYSWRIFVERYKRLILTFKDYSKGLKVFDGFDDSGLEVELEYSPWRFVSSSNVIFIMTSNPDLEYFKLEWEAVSSSAVEANATISQCHEVVTLPVPARANISSPGYPIRYENNLDCEWLIKTADPALHAEFLLFEAQLENINECSADYLRVSASNDLVNWFEKSKVCTSGPKTYQPLADIHGEPYLKIEFKSDSSISGKGFTSLLMTACGSNMTGVVGTILDSQILRARRSNRACLWHIAVHPGKRIRFTFDFGSEPMRKKTDDCPQYAVIYDGFDEQSPILPPGRICNHPDRKVSVLETTTNHAILKYNMSWPLGYPPRRLWNVTYREYSDCDEEIVLTHLASWVNISSPRYPNVPHPHTECNWIIVGPPGESIRADFIGRFDMNVRYCNKEYIEFHDGSTTLARSLGRFCMKTKTMLSTGNILHIHYLTDITEPRTGFQLNVSIAQCGGSYHTMFGEINSPRYPALGAYPRGTTCDYTIRLREKSRIALNLTDLHIPYDAQHLDASDYLEVLTYEENPTQLAIYYGNQTSPSLLQLDTSDLILRFHSVAPDNSKYRGFHIRYKRMFGPCNRDFTSSSGRITFTKLQLNANQRSCTWRIIVPKGQRVTLQFSTIQGRPTNISAPRAFNAYTNSALTFFNDVEMRSKILSLNITDSIPIPPIRSTDNKMLVVIHLFHNSFAFEKIEAAFNADDSSLCPPNIGIESMKGEIDLHGLLPGNFYCRTTFFLNGEETITFLIEELQVLKRSTFGYQAPLQFLNEEFAILFGKLDRNVSQFLVSLSSRRGSISFLQNDAIKMERFKASFYRHSCGGTYTVNANLVVESPTINGPTYGILECAWIFRAPISPVPYRMIGNFSFSDSCDREYIVLYAGVSPTFAEIARICKDTRHFNGTVLRKSLTSMVYHAAEYKPRQSSFRFKFEKSIVCGSKTLVAGYSNLVSIDSTTYRNNIECSWEFFTPPGLMLSLYFNGRFFIEESVNCTKDYLDISSYITESVWMQTARFCGREVPLKFNTSTNHIMVTFHTDDAITAEGFRFIVNAHCNAVLNVTEKTQILHLPSPNFMHLHVLECEYIFQTQSEEKINVRIKSNRNTTRISEWNRHCEYSSFTVERSDDDDSGGDDKICNEKEIRGSKRIKLTYNADVDMGYFIEYDLVACGGNITMPRLIRSVQAENDDVYVEDMNCMWYVSAPRDHSIIVRLKYFEMESHMKCEFDYLAVYKGSSVNEEKRVSKICGNLTANPPVIPIDGNQAVIVAVSDSSTSARGFVASVLFVPNCNERIALTDGNSPVALSRQFKINSTEEIFCYYHVMAPPGYRVGIEVKELQLNGQSCNASNCEGCNHIELYDSVGGERQSMGKFCTNGRMNVKRFSSYEDALLKINGAIPGDYSIELTLSMESKRCGSTDRFILRDNETVSLVFPPTGQGNYPPNTHCSWRIESDEKFQIRFDSFVLQNASQQTGECLDYLSVKVRYSLKIFCGNATGFMIGDVQTSNSNAQLIFHSDDAIESQGFKLTIARYDLRCNRTYNDLSGEIAFSLPPGQLNNCSPEIRVPDDYIISIYVIYCAFDSSDCKPNDYNLQIVDINKNETLRTHCGNIYRPLRILTETNAIRISLKNNTEINMFYVANRRTLPPGCGGKIFAFQGNLMSPSYDDRNASECRWEFIVPPPNRLFLNFMDFNMGSLSNCYLDYLQIFEVDSNGNEVLEKTMCGEGGSYAPYKSKGNRIVVFARKSPNFDGTGWAMSFFLVEDDNWSKKNFVNEFP